MNHKTLKGFFKAPNWIAEVCPPLEAKHITTLVQLLRWTQGFHRKKWKFTQTELAKKTRLHRNTISQVLKDLRDYGIIDYESKRGAITMVEVNTQIPIWLSNAQSECKSEKPVAQPVNKQCTTNGQPMHNESANPPLAKDILKDTIKDKSFDCNSFKEKWLFKKSNDEALKRILMGKFDFEKVEEAFNSLSLEQQKQVIQSLEYALQSWADVNFENRFLPQAHDYILKDKWKPFYEPIKAQIREEKIRLDRIVYLEEADKNKATDEERKEALSGFLKR